MGSWYALPPDRLDKLIRDPDFDSHLASRASRNILGLNQIYATHLRNSKELFRLEQEHEKRVQQIPKYRSLREKLLNEINQALHNYLASQYSLKEAVEGSFRELDMLEENQYRLRKFRDETRISHGLRVYVQHRGPLNLIVMAERGNGEEVEFKIGIWLSDIIPTEDIYYPVREQGGTKVDGIEYYFQNVENGFIDLFTVIRSAVENMINFYESAMGEICTSVTQRVDEFDGEIEDYLFEQGTQLPTDLGDHN